VRAHAEAFRSCSHRGGNTWTTGGDEAAGPSDLGPAPGTGTRWEDLRLRTDAAGLSRGVHVERPADDRLVNVKDYQT